MMAAAAEFLGVRQNTLRAWGKQAETSVQVNPLNNYRLFPWEDLQAFLNPVAEPVTRKAIKPSQSTNQQFCEVDFAANGVGMLVGAFVNYRKVS